MLKSLLKGDYVFRKLVLISSIIVVKLHSLELKQRNNPPFPELAQKVGEQNVYDVRILLPIVFPLKENSFF
jgi:hypothetical protein